MRSAELRLVVMGVVMIGFGGYFAVGIIKPTWPRITAQVMGVENVCVMQASESAGRDSTITDYTINCNGADQFRTEHPEKSWTLKQQTIAHLQLDTDPPVATNLTVYTPVQAGDVLHVIDDPARPARVLLDPPTSGVIAGLIPVGLGALLLAFVAGLTLVRRGRGTPPAPQSAGGGRHDDVFASRLAAAGTSRPHGAD